MGDEQAWEAFVLGYVNLIRAVVRRYLGLREPDEVRTVCADVLSALRTSKLQTYEGRAALSTWLTLVARAHVVDHLRRRFGRSRGTRVLARLPASHQRLFKMYHLEGRTPTDIVSALSSADDAWTLERFVAALRQIEQQLGDRGLRRIAYDLYAQSVGAASGRLLEYLDHIREEFQHTGEGAYSPEYHLMEREARRLDDRLREELLRLEPQDRLVLELRFERGWSAPEIAVELGLDGPRGVYTMLERALRKLRRVLVGPENRP